MIPRLHPVLLLGAALVCVAGMPCGPAEEDGVYRVLKHRDKQFLELYSAKNILRGRFEMELTGDTLRLRRTDTGGGEWRSMLRSEPAWCWTVRCNIATGGCA